MMVITMMMIKPPHEPLSFELLSVTIISPGRSCLRHDVPWIYQINLLPADFKHFCTLGWVEKKAMVKFAQHSSENFIFCRTNGTVYCQISQLDPPESRTEENHSEPASSALVRLKAEPRTPGGNMFENKDEDRQHHHLVCLHCQRCRCHHQLGNSWSSSRSPPPPRSPPMIKTSL